MQKYKAIISDIDGTLTPIIPHAVPSDKVTAAIKKAMEEGVIFSLASGRPFFLVEYLTKHLELTSPVITDNGAVIINSKDKSVLWEALLPREETLQILNITKKHKLTRLSCDTMVLENPLEVPGNLKIRKISVHDLTSTDAENLVKQIETQYKDLVVVRAASYKGENYTDLYISNAEATKLHSVVKYAHILGISKDEIIGIGDGYNDFPLLMACGLKVAMGNAVDELKEIADYVAPSVENDGVANVIEKYILS